MPMDTKREGQSYRQTLGSKIRMLREEQGLSLRKLGKMVDLDYQHIMNVELGKQGITIDALYKIACGLGVRVRDLIDF